MAGYYVGFVVNGYGTVSRELLQAIYALGVDVDASDIALGWVGGWHGQVLAIGIPARRASLA